MNLNITDATSIGSWICVPSGDEKPLDRLALNGGYCGIFRTIGCVGDSLSSGEFETLDAEGAKHYHDIYEYSWGQFIARMTGSKVYNFSQGGMTAKGYMEGFADKNDFWNTDKACQAYIIALGVNDVVNNKQEMGSIEDIDLANWQNNAHTFAGYYAMIVQRLKEIQPDAKFFFMTMPKTDRDTPDRISIRDAHAKLLEEMTTVFSNSYLLDFRKYAPIYDEEFRKRFYLNGHMNPCGYALTAQMVASYIDYIIRTNIEDFTEVGLIGTPYKNIK